MRSKRTCFLMKTYTFLISELVWFVFIASASILFVDRDSHRLLPQIKNLPITCIVCYNLYNHT